MSLPESVSRDQLLELARLEALGVLEEVDSDRLNRLFHVASAALQTEVRALQASICSDESLLSEEEPPVRLRGVAIMRVRDECTAEQAALAPIASIGPRRGGAVGSNEDQAIELVRVRAAFESTRQDLARWNRTAVMWRAASIVAGALLIVSLYYNLASNLYAVRIGQMAMDSNARETLMREIGPTYRDFTDGASFVRGLASTERGFSGSATVYVNRRSGQAMIIAFGLPEEARFTVRLVNEDGTTADLGTLVSSGQATVLRVDSGDSYQMAYGRWEIVDQSGAVVLRT